MAAPVQVQFYGIYLVQSVISVITVIVHLVVVIIVLVVISIANTNMRSVSAGSRVALIHDTIAIAIALVNRLI